MLSSFAKRRRKESTEKKEHEYKTDSSKPTCSAFTYESTEFDSAEERIKLDRPNIASDDIAKILPPNRSSNVDKLQLLKNAFRPVGEVATAFDFKKCCASKGQRFRNLNENHFKTSSWLVYSESRKASLVNCGFGKNRQKPRKLVIELFCSFNKLVGSDGYR